MEDRHLGGGRRAPGDGHAAHAVLRVPAGGAVRVAAAQGADRRRDGVRRRPAGDPRPARPRRRAQPRRARTSSCRLRPVLPEARAAQVSDALDAMGVRDRCISQLRQFVPGPAVVGAAFTMQCAPAERVDGERYVGCWRRSMPSAAATLWWSPAGRRMPRRCGASCSPTRASRAARWGRSPTG